MSASPVSSPETLSADSVLTPEEITAHLTRCASLDEDGGTALRFDLQFVSALYKSHELLRQQRDEARKKFREFSEHGENCNILYGRGCDCGLTDALALIFPESRESGATS